MRLRLLIVLTTVCWLFAGCLKKDDAYNEDVVSALSVVHSAPDTPPVDFILDGQRINYQSFEYGDRIKYFGVYSGNWQAAFYANQSTTSPLYKSQIHLINGKFYSLFLVGKKDQLDGVLLEDNVDAPPTGQAKIRFLHLAPDAGAVDFKLGDQTLGSQKKFKEYTDFQLVDPGVYTAQFISTDGSIQHTFSITIKPDEIYTVWLKGLVDTDQEEQMIGDDMINHSAELNE